jgi:hypothetical protein
MGNRKKDLQKTYEPVFEEIIEHCRQCNKKIDIVAKDLKPELNIVVFHATCYTEWMRSVKDWGIQTGIKMKVGELVE